MSYISGNIDSKEALVEAFDQMRSMLTHDDFNAKLDLEVFELNDKIDRLEKFIAGPKFDSVVPAQRALLVQQYGAMFAYANALQSRIDYSETFDEEEDEDISNKNEGLQFVNGEDLENEHDEVSDEDAKMAINALKDVLGKLHDASPSSLRVMPIGARSYDAFDEIFGEFFEPGYGRD